MDTKQGLFTQVVMIRWKESENKKGIWKITRKITSQGNLKDHGVGLISIVSGYKKISWQNNQISIKKLFQNKSGRDDKKNQLFEVSIGNWKITDEIQFHLAALVIEYRQKWSKSCCLSSLASAFHIIGDNRAGTILVNFIKE